jgi:hypothetical protein
MAGLDIAAIMFAALGSINIALRQRIGRGQPYNARINQWPAYRTPTQRHLLWNHLELQSSFLRRQISHRT